MPGRLGRIVRWGVVESGGEKEKEELVWISYDCGDSAKGALWYREVGGGGVVWYGEWEEGAVWYGEGGGVLVMSEVGGEV